MRRSSFASRLEALQLTAAATLGTLPIALLSSAAIARFFPVSPDARFALAFTFVIPSWIAAMCVAFVARSGARALLGCLAISVALAAIVFGIP